MKIFKNWLSKFTPDQIFQFIANVMIALAFCGVSGAIIGSAFYTNIDLTDVKHPINTLFIGSILLFVCAGLVGFLGLLDTAFLNILQRRRSRKRKLPKVADVLAQR